jgi:hypothetical protein
VLLPVVLILMAVVSAGAFAYGTHSDLAQFAHGVDAIILTRRLEWLLFAVSLLFCLLLFALVVSGKRRIYWLLGLALVLGLFFHKFRSDPINAFMILEDPPYVAARDASFLDDADWVVGLRFGDDAYAYPFSTLYVTPVIVQNDRDKRMVLLWSAFANRARVAMIDRDIKARDLEIVSFPANSLLLYNSRYGEFVSSVPLTTPDGRKPAGFRGTIATVKTQWKLWKAQNPATKVLAVRPQFPNLPPTTR